MVQREGIEVYVVRDEDNKRHEEYKFVYSCFQSGESNQVFIESVAGERFAIVVKCLPSFDWKNTAALRIQYWIDNREFDMVEFLTEIDVNNPDPSEQRRQVRLESETWLVDGKWTSCGLAFEDAEIGKLPNINS